MRRIASISAAAAVVGLVALVACVGDEPVSAPGPSQADAAPSDASSPGDGSPSSGSFCANVPPAGEKETVFCEDFESDYASRWGSASEGGSLSTTDVEGSKVLDVALNVTSASDYIGPRLIWRKIPRAGAAEVSFDFMLVEGPSNPANTGLLWFARIGALGSASVGFGARLTSTSIEYGALFSAGPGDMESETTFSFGPKQWTRVTLRYTTTAKGSDQFVSVGANPEYAASLEGAGLELIESDAVSLGVFVRGAPAVVRARFDNVVIRTTKP